MLAPGTRVRLRGRPPGIQLQGTTGSVVRAEQWEPFSIVLLDEPARYDNADGTVDTLPEVRWAEDNMEVLPAA